jgi:DNA-binding NarL/FixJ family response regulator
MRPAKCILHLEDDEMDSILFREELRTLNFPVRYQWVSSVGEAMRYLGGEGKYADRTSHPKPDLIVMDTGLHGPQSTADLLTWMNGRREMEDVVTVALTGTSSPEVRDALLAQGVSAVLPKGADMETFAKSVSNILRRFFD